MHEAQNILLESNLRFMVKLQTDGGLKVGLDVIKAAIFGADSFGFGTAPMIARVSTLEFAISITVRLEWLPNTSKSLINNLMERLRRWNYFLFVAQEVREYLAQLGYKSLNEIIGKTNLLHLKPETKSKAENWTCQIKREIQAQ